MWVHTQFEGRISEMGLDGYMGGLLDVDEAHATLVTGQHGGGAAEAMGVEGSIDVYTGGLKWEAHGVWGGRLKRNVSQSP